MIFLSVVIIIPKVRPSKKLNDGGRMTAVCIARISSFAIIRVISIILFASIVITTSTFTTWRHD